MWEYIQSPVNYPPALNWLAPPLFSFIQTHATIGIDVYIIHLVCCLEACCFNRCTLFAGRTALFTNDVTSSSATRIDGILRPSLFFSLSNSWKSHVVKTFPHVDVVKTWEEIISGCGCYSRWRAHSLFLSWVRVKASLLLKYAYSKRQAHSTHTGWGFLFYWCWFDARERSSVCVGRRTHWTELVAPFLAKKLSLMHERSFLIISLLGSVSLLKRVAFNQQADLHPFRIVCCIVDRIVSGMMTEGAPVVDELSVSKFIRLM